MAYGQVSFDAEAKYREHTNVASQFADQSL